LPGGVLKSFRPQTILVTGARAPVALHWARLLHGAGHRVVLADTLAAPIASASTACDAYRRLPPPRFAPDAYAAAVVSLLREERIDCVIPTCEEVFWLGAIWRGHAMPAVLFAPPMDLLARVHDKHAFIRLAEGFGLAVPETILLRGPDDLEAVRPRSRELVFKPVWSRFARHVLLRPAPWRLRAVRPSASAPWVAQRFVQGDEICAWAAARNGEVRALALYRSRYRAGQGAGICLEPVTDRGAREFVEAFVAHTRWSGQISFDLMRCPGGQVLPLECNPRATSGLHFFANPAAFADAVLGAGEAVRPDVDDLLAVRLALWMYGLPAALRRGEPGHFRATLARARELLDWPGDPVPLTAQLRSLAEIAAIALREGITLQAASTRDIEWNGPDQSAPCAIHDA
jgi:hypothetical protein